MSEMRIVRFSGPYEGYNILQKIREDVYSVVVADNAIEMQLCVIVGGHLETIHRKMMLPCPVTEARDMNDKTEA